MTRVFLTALLLPFMLVMSTGCGTSCTSYAGKSQQVLNQFAALHQQALQQSGNDLNRTLDAMRKARLSYEEQPAPDCAVNVKLTILSAMNIAIDDDSNVANSQLLANTPEGRLALRTAELGFQRAQEEIARLK